MLPQYCVFVFLLEEKLAKCAGWEQDEQSKLLGSVSVL